PGHVGHLMFLSARWCKRADHHVLPGDKPPDARGVGQVAPLYAEVGVVSAWLRRVARDRRDGMAAPQRLGQHPLPDHSLCSEQHDLHGKLLCNDNGYSWGQIETYR